MSETQPRSPGAVCAAWWRRTFGADDGDARMVRARFRRCATPAEALAVEAVHDLNAQLRAVGYRPGADRLALVAIVLAHVTESGNRRLARGVRPAGIEGRPPCAQRTAFSDAGSHDRSHPSDCPAAPCHGHRSCDACPRGRVGRRPCIVWNENVRTGWCFQYYGASDAVPAQSETNLEEIEA